MICVHLCLPMQSVRDMPKFKTPKRELEELLEEATVDTYGDEEQFSGVLTTLQDNLPFPFQAKAVGEPVEVLGIDERRSSPERGILAKVRKGGKEYRVALSELEVPEDFEGRKWLEMYEYWGGGD